MIKNSVYIKILLTILPLGFDFEQLLRSMLWRYRIVEILLINSTYLIQALAVYYPSRVKCQILILRNLIDPHLSQWHDCRFIL